MPFIPSLKTEEIIELSLECIAPGILCFLVASVLALRQFKLLRAGLFYNKQRSRSVFFKRVFLMCWAVSVFVCAALVFLPTLKTAQDNKFAFFVK